MQLYSCIYLHACTLSLACARKCTYGAMQQTWMCTPSHFSFFPLFYHIKYGRREPGRLVSRDPRWAHVEWSQKGSFVLGEKGGRCFLFPIWSCVGLPSSSMLEEARIRLSLTLSRWPILSSKPREGGLKTGPTQSKWARYVHSENAQGLCLPASRVVQRRMPNRHQVLRVSSCFPVPSHCVSCRGWKGGQGSGRATEVCPGNMSRESGITTEAGMEVGRAWLETLHHLLPDLPQPSLLSDDPWPLQVSCGGSFPTTSQWWLLVGHILTSY